MSDKEQQPTKATVFISYAREDENFVRVLRSALQDRGFEVKGDWLLTTGDDYAKRLHDFNLEAHAFIFLISPDSIKSEACRNELTHAVEHKKQILPISHRNHGDDNLLDSALRSPQWTMLRAGDDFESGIENLVRALNTDFALMDMHSRLLVAADNWSNHGRNRSYLWRKDGLKNAESWLAVTSAQPDKLPQPTPLQIEFIFAGQRARSRGTRIGFGIVLGVAAALTFVSIVALAQRSRAISNAEDANTQRQTAEKNAKEADRQAGIATEKAAEAERQRLLAEKNAKEAERQTGIAKTNEQAARTQQRLAEERRVEAERQRLLVKKSFVDSQLALGTALIKEGRMAEGLWSYWLAYENTTPEDPARQSALKLIGSWSQLAGRPLVLDNGLREVKFSRDEKTVLTITDRAAQLWDIQTGEPIGEKIAASDAPWQAMAVSPDASTLVVARNASAEIWNIRTGKRHQEPLQHGEKISYVAFSADGTAFFTQGKQLIRFWNAETGMKYGDAQIDRAHYYATLAPDGKSAFLGFDDSILLNLSSSQSTKVPFWPHHDRNNYLATFSPNGKILIAAGNTEEEIRDYEHAEVWRVGSDKLLENEISHRGSFTSITFSPNNRNFLTGGGDNTAYIWSVYDEKIVRQGPPLYHGGSVVSGAFSYGNSAPFPAVLT
ncbi:MAG TPA: TIR domain-containing protein, partial [Pyrinomonadaceae bacterium]